MTDDELFEALDAYLDGELSPDELRQVEAFLARSEQARAELEDIDRVRRAVRGLPPVEPPGELFRQLLAAPAGESDATNVVDFDVAARRRRRRVPGLTAAAIGAAAACLLLMFGLSPVGDRLSPPLQQFEQRHDQLVSSQTAVDDDFAPMPVSDVSTMSEHYVMPDAMPAGYEPMGAYHGTKTLQLVFTNGTAMVSVFQQEGTVDWDGLPEGGSMMSVADDQAWAMHADGDEMVVVDNDGIVVTVIGSSMDDAMAIADAMPDPASPSVGDRMSMVCRDLARSFGFPT